MKMLKSYCIWTSLLLVTIPGLYATREFDANASQKRTLRAEFVRAMEQATGRNANQGDSVLSRLAEMATPAHHTYPDYYESSSTSPLHFSTETARNLEEYQDYAINLTQYALKYIGCSNIKTWSDQEAQAGNNVLKTDRFVVLRLCPRESCSNYNEYGCLEQFGDYLIPMESYLQIMAETFFTQYLEYCETCYECMTGQQANNNYNNNNNNYNDNYNYNGNQNYNYYNGNQNYNYNNNNGGRDLNQAGDDAWYKNWNNNYNGWYYGDDAANNQANDDTYNYNQWSCDKYDVCEEYKTACQDYTNLAFDLQDYFQCAEFNIGGAIGYMGPHCASDGKTIDLGVFTDENCYEFAADLKSMSSYMQVSESEFESYTSNKCISCLASDGYTLNVDDNGYAYVSDICGELYGEAAKCNKYMGYNDNYASQNQEMQENRVCSFIKNLLSNSYDEYGEIYVKEDETWMSYVAEIQTMPQWQKYTLSSTVLLSVGLFAYACYLHRQLTQRKFVWYPRARRGYSSNPGEATAISGRMQSGIIQGRSRSSGDFEMKKGGLLS